MKNQNYQKDKIGFYKITKEQIREQIIDAIESLYDYDLYGTKESIDLVRDVLPYNIKPIEVPEGFLPNSKKVYLIKREYLKGYGVYDFR